MKKKVCVLGSGNWGSAIAKIIGNNVLTQNDKFEEIVTMYVYEEIVDGQKLTDIINTTHENVKYLPGHRIPENVIAVPDVVEAAKDADILIFIVPHQFVKGICGSLKGKIKAGAAGLSLIKGCDHAPGGGLLLISQIIGGILSIPVSVLMGANLAHEVAEEKFCEATVGSSSLEFGVLMQDLLETDYFHISVVDDVETVEMCGALKNVVACAAGLVDGLGLGDNTKAAVIRLGLMEMIKFIQEFFPGGRIITFFESCGIGDLLTTCYGGRNHKVCEAFAKTNKSIEQLENEILNGQKLQGPVTAAEVNHMLRDKEMENKFPLFTAVHEICVGNMKADMLVKKLSKRPRAC